MQRLRLTKNKTTCKEKNGAVIVQRKKTVGISYPISVTFVEVQLGSGGVLCVAQGTALSHGTVGED